MTMPVEKWSKTRRWALWGLAGVGLLLLGRLLPFEQWMASVRAWTEGQGVWGAAGFGLVYILGGVAMVPGSILTIAAGAIFGLALGTVIVSISATISAVLSFVIARYLSRAHVERLSARSPRFRALDRAIRDGGWKMVGLLRLSPVVPFSVGNYLYGLTGVSFWSYTWATWIGSLPGTILYVYIGHVGGAGLGADRQRSPLEWGLLGVGLAATIGIVVYLSSVAKHAVVESSAPDAT